MCTIDIGLSCILEKLQSTLKNNDQSAITVTYKTSLKQKSLFQRLFLSYQFGFLTSKLRNQSSKDKHENILTCSKMCRKYQEGQQIIRKSIMKKRVLSKYVYLLFWKQRFHLVRYYLHKYIQDLYMHPVCKQCLFKKYINRWNIIKNRILSIYFYLSSFFLSFKYQQILSSVKVKVIKKFQQMSSNTKQKNHFDIDPIFQQPKQKLNQPNKILIDKVDMIMKQKFSFLIQVYLNNASQNGYNSKLAFRVITLYLHCDFKSNQQGLISFNLIQQINRFLNEELSKGELINLRRCMDLLVIKQINQRIADKYLKFWRIKVLYGLKKYYAVNHMKKQKKKASFTMREMCKQQLKKQAVKHETQMYTSILDILLDEQKLLLNNKKTHGKTFQAIENANNIIRILQKAQQVIIPKYQQQLMLGYWQVAKLHFELHYVTYAKKYCQTTINIAQRINDKKIIALASNMLETLTQK